MFKDGFHPVKTKLKMRWVFHWGITCGTFPVGLSLRDGVDFHFEEDESGT